LKAIVQKIKILLNKKLNFSNIAPRAFESAIDDSIINHRCGRAVWTAGTFLYCINRLRRGDKKTPSGEGGSNGMVYLAFSYNLSADRRFTISVLSHRRMDNIPTPAN